jgi:hypothetical protein
MSVLLTETNGWKRLFNIINFPLGLLLIIGILILQPKIGYLDCIVYVLIFPGWLQSLIYWIKNIYINIHITL